MINGAAGTIGTFAVQLAKQFGAEVTAVDRGDKLNVLRSIGADRVVDYTSVDVAQGVEAYDLILDIANSSALRLKSRLSDRGHYVSSKRRTRFSSEDLSLLREFIEAGKLRSVIDRVYPLEQAAAAHRYVENGGKTGNVVLTVA